MPCEQVAPPPDELLEPPLDPPLDELPDPHVSPQIEPTSPTQTLSHFVLQQ